MSKLSNYLCHNEEYSPNVAFVPLHDYSLIITAVFFLMSNPREMSQCVSKMNPLPPWFVKDSGKWTNYLLF